MKRARLVVFALSYYSSQTKGGEISGAETRLLNIIKEVKKKFKLGIVCDETAFKTFQERGFKGKYNIFPLYFPLAGQGFNYFLRILTGLFFLPKQVDLIYCYTDFLPDTMTAFLYKMFHKNSSWIQTINHVITNPQKRKGGRLTAHLSFYSQKISHLLIKYGANNIIAISPLVRDDLLRLGFPSQKLALSSAGVDFDYFQKIKPSLTKYDGVFMGRLNPTKGVFDLVDIWKQVTRDLPVAKLAIIGGAENENILRELRQRIKKSGLTNNVKILGFLPEKSAFAIIKSAQIFLFPSHEEGWGISIAESMSCGTPVLTWDLPVFKEIFFDKIQKTRENNINVFAGKVVSVIKNKNLRKKISAEGKKFIRKYNWENVAANEESIFEQALVSDK